MKFKIGDIVRINQADEGRLFDFESDLVSDLEDGCITGRRFDQISKAIRDDMQWEVTKIEDIGCELTLCGTKTILPWMLEYPDIKRVKSK